jgi:hypothetical protein
MILFTTRKNAGALHQERNTECSIMVISQKYTKRCNIITMPELVTVEFHYQKSVLLTG